MFLSAYYLCATANSPSFLQNAASLVKNWVSSLFQNNTLETAFYPVPKQGVVARPGQLRLTCFSANCWKSYKWQPYQAEHEPFSARQWATPGKCSWPVLTRHPPDDIVGKLHVLPIGYGGLTKVYLLEEHNPQAPTTSSPFFESCPVAALSGPLNSLVLCHKSWRKSTEFRREKNVENHARLWLSCFCCQHFSNMPFVKWHLGLQRYRTRDTTSPIPCAPKNAQKSLKWKMLGYKSKGAFGVTGHGWLLFFKNLFLMFCSDLRVLSQNLRMARFAKKLIRRFLKWTPFLRIAFRDTRIANHRLEAIHANRLKIMNFKIVSFFLPSRFARIDSRESPGFSGANKAREAA